MSLDLVERTSQSMKPASIELAALNSVRAAETIILRGLAANADQTLLA